MTVAIVRGIQRALERQDLSRAEMAEIVGQIMDGQATAAQIGGLLVALRAKGEAVDELVGAAAAMRSRALALQCPSLDRSIDTCGTGGDGSHTVNISTLAAILIAACGGVVAKHGNRALSSKCGSADVLEALGVGADVEPAVVERSMQVANIGFAFAPRFHAATRHASGPRKELGTRTIFNLLGPLTNPANVRHQVVGVFDRKWCEHVASALGALGLRRAAVVHGEGNIDEIAVRGETHVAIWDEPASVVRTLQLSPRSFGVRECDPSGLAGGDAAFNANVLRKVIAGRDCADDQRYEAVLHAAAMTAALGLELLQESTLDLSRLPVHYERAVSVVRSGEARLVLHKWREVSNATLGESLDNLAALKPSDYIGVE
ncbi:MAG TPA: anthranilate phosphoribosyltransferase [Kofleriaceae bacterium]|nr:anthranilate phosphoribosyltransferase [Kofleriaceae bacterium]